MLSGEDQQRLVVVDVSSGVVVKVSGCSSTGSLVFGCSGEDLFVETSLLDVVGGRSAKACSVETSLGSVSCVVTSTVSSLTVVGLSVDCLFVVKTESSSFSAVLAISFVPSTSVELISSVVPSTGSSVTADVSSSLACSVLISSLGYSVVVVSSGDASKVISVVVISSRSTSIVLLSSIRSSSRMSSSVVSPLASFFSTFLVCSVITSISD